jgi:hypothetical protein
MWPLDDANGRTAVWHCVQTLPVDTNHDATPRFDHPVAEKPSENAEGQY